MERWQLNQSSSRYYDRFMVPVLFEPWAERLVKAARLREGSRVLDLACGTGVVARAAARAVGSGGEVVGVDLNAGMLAVARSIPAASGPRVRWRQSDAASLPFRDSSFDAVLCQQGFQFFPDRHKAAREAARVLRPEGCLAVNVWRGAGENPWGAAVIDSLRTHAGPEMARGLRQPFSVPDGHAVAAAITDAGLRIIRRSRSKLILRAPSAASFLEGFLKALPFASQLSQSAHTAMLSDCLSALNGHARGGRLRVSSAVNVIIAVKPLAPAPSAKRRHV